MLAERLEQGWTPTPSQLKAGEQVLGYAGCTVTREHRTSKA
jgi:hypothetical protein